MSTRIHEPGEGIRTIDIGGSVISPKADDPEAVGPLLARIDMEMLAPAAS